MDGGNTLRRAGPARIVAALGVFAFVILVVAAVRWRGGETGRDVPGGQPPPAAPGAPETRLTVETVAAGLEVPWALALAPDRAGTIYITERPGRVRVIREGRLLPAPALTLPVAAEGEGGLLGLALDPDFLDTPYVYLYYTYRSAADGGLRNRVSRFKVVERDEAAGVHLGEEEVLLDGLPGAPIHDGGRLAFGPDGKLYITTGDARQPALAADPSSLAGKILRLNDDGSVPPDNPFPGSPVWSYGHRNPQGLAWHPRGVLFAAEHGPTGESGLCCHDEVNLIEPGRFYGWPLRAGGVPAAAAGPKGGDAQAEPVDPVAESGGDTWAPSGIAFYRGDRLPWRGNLLVATLRGQHLRRFVLDPGDPGRVTAQEVVLDGYGRLRDVVEGPDGCVYLLTSNRDGRGRPATDDDRVLRLCPR